MVSEMAFKIKRRSISGPYPGPLAVVDHTHINLSDTTDDEFDGHIHLTRETTPPTKAGTPKHNKGVSFEMSTPRGGRKRLWRRKRRSSNSASKEDTSVKDNLVKKYRHDNEAASHEALLQPTSESPLPSTDHTSHASPSHSPHHSDPETQISDLTNDPQNQDSSSKLNQEPTSQPSQTAPYSHEVATFIESVRYPSHLTSRSGSNSSLRTHRRQNSNGSINSFRIASSPCASPVKGQSRCNSASSLQVSRSVSANHRTSLEPTPTRKGSGSAIPYTKLDTSDSETDGTENGNETQPSSTQYQYYVPVATSEPIEGNSQTTTRDLYSNESSADTRASDGGHDADSELSHGEDNLHDRSSEAEPNESNVESSLTSPYAAESDDLTSISTPDILGSNSTSNLISMSSSGHLRPLSPEVIVQSTPPTNINSLISQFESNTPPASSSTTSLIALQIPLHIRRDPVQLTTGTQEATPTASEPVTPLSSIHGGLSRTSPANTIMIHFFENKSKTPLRTHKQGSTSSMELEDSGFQVSTVCVCVCLN